MIQLTRPYPAPSVLTTLGANQTALDVTAYAAGTLVFSVDRAIYAHDSVKSLLKAMTREKCAYCESKIGATDYPNIDHYRPSAAWKNADGGVEYTPGYFWLAYQWENLLLVCQRCNCSHKRTIFPLENSATRVTQPGAPLTGEARLFIDPSIENPATFLRYRREVVYAVGNSPRGLATRDILDLNGRQSLVERRRCHLRLVEAAFETAVRFAGTPVGHSAREAVLDAISPNGEFSAMIDAALGHRLHELPP